MLGMSDARHLGRTRASGWAKVNRRMAEGNSHF